MEKQFYDIIIIGAGVIGSAAARAFSRYSANILVLERESDVGEITSAANSAIVHSGYDPPPGSLKAEMNVSGNRHFAQLCDDLDIEMKKIGSMTIAVNEEEATILRDLEKRAALNGVPVQMLDQQQALALEPNLTPEVRLALLAPTAGIVNTFELCVALMENAMDNGVELHLNEEVRHVSSAKNFSDSSESEYSYAVETKRGLYQAKIVINAAGLFADRLSNEACGTDYKITPRKGEYFVLDHFDPDFVRHTIFSVPSSKGKGILVSPTTHGNYLIGPSSEFVDHKDDYATDSPTLEQVMIAAKKLVPSIPNKQIIRQFAGLRAVEKDGHFVIEQPHPGWINLLGIQSPGLTSCQAIAERAVDLIRSGGYPLREKLNWQPRRRPVIRLNKMTPDQRAVFVAEHPEFGNIICRCEAVSEGEVLDCIRRNCGAVTVRGVKKRVRPGFGKCQGGFCQPRVIKILARELELPPEKIRYKGPGSWILLERTKISGDDQSKNSNREKK